MLYFYFRPHLCCGIIAAGTGIEVGVLEDGEDVMSDFGLSCPKGGWFQAWRDLPCTAER